MIGSAIANVADIRPDAKQPRKYFKQSALEALAKSLRLVGQRTPIQVKVLKGEKHKYEIIDGERRWRAHQLAGLKTIRITVEEQKLDERKQHLLSTISNFHRENHTHMEISDALHFQRVRGETVAVLADNLDKSEGWVYQYLKLQELAPDLKAKMHPETDDQAMLRFSEAVVLASLPPEQQTSLYRDGLKYERGSRLALYRKRASVVQQKERTGRPTRPREQLARYETFIDTINQYLDIALELKEKEFDHMLIGSTAYQIRQMTDRLGKVRDDIGVLLGIIERKLTIGEGEGDIPGLEQVDAAAVPA